jgi:hypothetical protein
LPKLVPEALGSSSSEALMARLPLVPEKSHAMHGSIVNGSNNFGKSKSPSISIFLGKVVMLIAPNGRGCIYMYLRHNLVPFCI